MRNSVDSILMISLRQKGRRREKENVQKEFSIPLPDLGGEMRTVPAISHGSLKKAATGVAPTMGRVLARVVGGVMRV